ncbi:MULTISPECIES: ATP-binding protein [unclassified Curtobacterium]|uniref:ATP-binding protein n=1 Tax=unclassified Curtobacterium TaxID=257496 RepID=UPI000F48CFE5|nr:MULTISPECIES: ATP-binding protein [unclassified Curtobacterium]ROQ16779.1 AAA ATPase-like protein [Curtobacterium sp. PhB171]ROQ25144.1 AAA ATPase-like protein [Curtobacterium sp. PhB170]ROS36595.1 AAA ATPase-like protein [Curtobacterium sp. PhB131]ROS71273.1 AAA ATPase-like protein [Curtobacterium sp. PhB141]
MDSVRNPYTPNAGATPEIVAGRFEHTRAFEVLLQRLARGRTDQSLIMTGLRGVGKTVLLNEFAELARTANWEVVELEASKHDDGQFRQTMASLLRSALLQISPRKRWTDRARRAAEVLTAFGMSVDHTGTWSMTWDVEPAEGLADHGDLALDLTDVLVALGQAAQEHGRGVAILVDEVQFLRSAQLEAMIQALHKTVQRKLPITFVGAGLPQIAELAGDAKSYAERLFRFPEIDSLGDDDAREALIRPAELEEASFASDAVDLALEITKGYPYFLQELGYQAWEIAAGPEITADDIDAAREGYLTKLDRSFFRVRLDRATGLQTAYLRAMAELGPDAHKAADVARVLNRESTQLGPTRAELIDMGLLYTPEHGYAAFTVPDFDQFMLRAVPELVIPEVRRRARRNSDGHL